MSDRTHYVGDDCPGGHRRISLAIMAHPQREAMVTDLAGQLDQEPVVVWDRHNDRWDTGKRALLSYGDSADYHVVIQDDTLVSPRLMAGVAAMLAVLPAGVPIGLYYGSAKPRRAYHERMYEAAKAEGARWIVLSESPMWGVGLVIPTVDVEDIVELGDSITSTNNYDTRVATYYQRKHVEQWYPIPSPVEHRSPGASLVPGRSNGRRVAHEFLGEASAADIDWNGPVVRQPKRLPTLTEQRRAW